jgi:type I restriction enzyme, S subunit
LVFSARLLRVRPKEGLSAEYLSFYFQGESFKQRVISAAVGQTMASLNTVILKSIIVSYPSLREQTSIAKILSDINADVIVLEARRDKTQSLEQGMVQQLLSGNIRLV